MTGNFLDVFASCMASKSLLYQSFAGAKVKQSQELTNRHGTRIERAETEEN